jgi:hypothetical protein
MINQVLTNDYTIKNVQFFINFFISCLFQIIKYSVTHSQLLEGLKCESQTENSGIIKNQGTLVGLHHFERVKGRVEALGWD